LRGAAFEVQLTGQPESAHAVDQAKVDDLGDASLIRADVARADAEDLGRGRPMHILALRESLQQTRVLGKMGHDPQFDLRIVRRDNASCRRER
jgi:hypothetical protein